jgi:hypothetical protein
MRSDTLVSGSSDTTIISIEDGTENFRLAFSLVHAQGMASGFTIINGQCQAIPSSPAPPLNGTIPGAGNCTAPQYIGSANGVSTWQMHCNPVC